MENMIKKIVDADNEAKAMEQAALDEKEKLSESIDAECQRIYNEYMATAEQLVERNKEKAIKRAEKRQSEFESRHKSVKIKLESDFKLNRDRWVDEIVKRTIAAE